MKIPGLEIGRYSVRNMLMVCIGLSGRIGRALRAIRGLVSGNASPLWMIPIPKSLSARIISGTFRVSSFA